VLSAFHAGVLEQANVSVEQLKRGDVKAAAAFAPLAAPVISKETNNDSNDRRKKNGKKRRRSEGGSNANGDSTNNSRVVKAVDGGGSHRVIRIIGGKDDVPSKQGAAAIPLQDRLSMPLEALVKRKSS